MLIYVTLWLVEECCAPTYETTEKFQWRYDRQNSSGFARRLALCTSTDSCRRARGGSGLQGGWGQEVTRRCLKFTWLLIHQAAVRIPCFGTTMFVTLTYQQVLLFDGIQNKMVLISYESNLSATSVFGRKTPFSDHNNVQVTAQSGTPTTLHTCICIA